MESISMHIIAGMRSDFPTKFGIPRQSGLVESLNSTIIFEEPYRNNDALRGLEGFSHLWIIWQFSASVRENWTPTVRPPRLGGNTRLGVFATRSPFRPNSIGLSSVRISHIEQTKNLGTVIHVTGADLMDGTPILDIKPYIPYTDCHPNATGGFSDSAADFLLDVSIPPVLLQKIPKSKQQSLIDILSHDPRPSYQDDPSRIYGLLFAGFNVQFTIQNKLLHVCNITQTVHD